jgi:hypothetical protein
MNHFTNIDAHDKYPADKQLIKMLEENFRYLNYLAYLAYDYNMFLLNTCLVLDAMYGIVVIIDQDDTTKPSQPMIVKVDNTNLLRNIINGSDSGQYTLVKNSKSITITGEDETEYKDVLRIDEYQIKAETNPIRAWKFYGGRDLFRRMLTQVLDVKELGSIYMNDLALTVYDSSVIRSSVIEGRADVFINGEARSNITSGERDAQLFFIDKAAWIQHLGLNTGTYPIPVNVYVNFPVAAYFICEAAKNQADLMLKTFGNTIPAGTNITISGSIPIR